MSLTAVARATRVHPGFLQALERDDLTELPEPPFTRGFIRAYCQVLGVPSDDALRLYAAQIGTPTGGPTSDAPTRLPDRDARGREPVFVSLVLLIALGMALFAVITLQARSKDGPPRDRASASWKPSPDLPAAGARGSAGRSVAPESTASVGSPMPAAPAPASSRVVNRLVARVKEKTWVRVRTDDGRVIEEMMSPGDVKEWVSNERFLLTIGNAGGLALELNGRSLPPLGPSGAVIPQLVIPADRP
jgi:cytoskeletal protein RodZ